MIFLKVCCAIFSFFVSSGDISNSFYESSSRPIFAVNKVRIFTLPTPKYKISKKIPKPEGNGLFSSEKFSKNEYDQKLLQNFEAKIEKILTSLPARQVQALRSVEIQNVKHTSRGMANDHVIVLHTQSITTQDELTSVFIHEFGHVVDLGILVTNKRTPSVFYDKKNIVFEGDPSLSFYELSWQNASELKEGTTRQDFVSGYALSNPFEDFAESYVYYRLHGEKFRKIAKNSKVLAQKYLFLKSVVFAGQEFQLEIAEPSTVADVFDATLIPLNAGERVVLSK